MQKDPSQKYRPFPPVRLPDRQWPDRVLTAAPRWCSVDLRDGNQALAVPMNVSQKLELFSTLVKCGFKEIEVGFPSASNTEFTFNRRLIEERRAPDDVWLQVLVQAREDLIERTFESPSARKKSSSICTTPRRPRKGVLSSACQRSRLCRSRCAARN